MLRKNFSYSTVATAPSPATSGTSLTVRAADGSKFTVGPATVWPPGTPPLASNAEEVVISAIATDTFTLVRGTQSSTALAISAGWQIAQGPTAGGVLTYNVMELGAVGDGSTDDTAALQLALDSVPSGGGTVFINDGTYKVTSSLLVKQTSTRVLCSGGAVIQCDGSVVTTLIKPNATGLSRIRIEGGKWLQTNVTVQGVGFDFSDTANCVIAPARVEAFGTGIKINDTTNSTFYNTYRDIQIFDCNTCIAIGVDSTSTQPNDNWFYSVRCRPKAGGGGYGVRVADARGVTFVALDVEAATATGITGVSLEQNATSLGFAREVTFVNPWIENLATGVSIASGCSRVSFFGGTITGNTADISDSGTETVFLNTNQTGNTRVSGMLTQRWIFPYNLTVNGAASAAQSANTVAGTVILLEFEVLQSCTIDAIGIQNGATVSGNVTVGIYGPIPTEETCAGAAVLGSSASTALAGTTVQVVSLSSAVYAKKGRYYVAIEYDTAGASQYLRTANQAGVVGWGQSYARVSGYGALTDPCPTISAMNTNLPGVMVRCSS